MKTKNTTDMKLENLHNRVDVTDYDDYIKKQLKAQSNDPIGVQLKYFDWLKLTPIDTDVVLDIGCGQGQVINHFNKIGYKSENIYGVDINTNKTKNINNDNVYECDMHNMNIFENDFFNLIYSTHVLEHAIKPQEVFNEIRRILKPNGICFIAIPYPEPDKYDDVHVGKYDMKTNWDYAIKDKEGTGYLDFIRSNGFNVIKSQVIVQSKRLSEIWKVPNNPSYRQDEIWVLIRKTK